MAEAAASLSSPAAVRVAPRRVYIAGPAYDLVFFLLAPWLALGVAFSLFRMTVVEGFVQGQLRSDFTLMLAVVFGPVLTQAHIFLVFFRSHLNAQVFRRHTSRFTLVPAALIIGIMTSMTTLITARVLAQLWDIYHSSLQTFGLGRIYDRQAGNDPAVGRWLDIVLAHVVYVGPWLAGVNLIHTLVYFFEFGQVGWPKMAAIPLVVLPFSALIKTWVIRLTLGFLAFYLLYYGRLFRKGYRISWPKIVLYANTAVASVAAWGYFPDEVCILTINFFHAWQYFGIVWWTERGNIQTRLHLSRVRWGAWLALVIMVGVSAGYGFTSHQWGSGSRLLMSLILTCSLMHFWWDGFIWSVRKHHV